MKKQKKINDSAKARSYRIPEHIILWLKQRIKKSCRSINAEVVYILTQAKDNQP